MIELRGVAFIWVRTFSHRLTFSSRWSLFVPRSVAVASFLTFLTFLFSGLCMPFCVTFGIINQLATRIWGLMASVFPANNIKAKENNLWVFISAPRELPLYSTCSCWWWFFFLFVSVGSFLLLTSFIPVRWFIWYSECGGNPLPLAHTFNIVVINKYCSVAAVCTQYITQIYMKTS